jgi:hypothetical protein
MKTAQPITVRRLEQFLRSYDEFMWATGVASKGEELYGRKPQFPLKGPLIHYPELRRHLLEIDNIGDFDIDRFFFELPKLSEKGTHESETVFLEPSVHGAWMLASWVTESRRVYNIDPDLQALLGATSIESVLTDDIKLPFGSFGIQLEHPIYAGGDGDDREFDFILYGAMPWVREDSNKGLILPTIMLFNTALDKWHPASCRDNVERKIKRGKHHDAWGLVERHNAIQRNTGLVRLSCFELGENGTVGELIETIDERVEYGKSAVTQAWRLVYGLCLYLTSLPSDSSKVSAWMPTEKVKRVGVSPDLSAITDESQICTVASIRKLTTEDREMLFRQVSGRTTGYEMRAHFRMGHWRRPPRTAQNSEQPKTVWVQPTLVRRDRLPEGAIPHGAQVDLSA